MTLVPKFTLVTGASSLACGTKSRLASPQVRVALLTMAAAGSITRVMVVRFGASM